MTHLISVLSTTVLALAPCVIGLQNLRNVQTLEPSVPEFLSRADSTLRYISRHLVANAPSEVEMDLQAQAEGDRNSKCKFTADEDFRLESLNQSEDLRFCAQRGLKHIMKFAEPFPLEDKLAFMPTFSSHSLTKRAKGVTHAVIWMHGGRMNANKYACDALNLTEAAGAAKQTLTLVPFFSEEKMTKKQWTRDPHAKHQASVCWNSSQAWMRGGESSDGATTAFGVLDRMVMALQTKAFRRNFPHLKRIVIAGFSGGCQLLQRWSFFSDVLRPDYSKIPVTLILGSCGSYMYLDDTRPAESCSPLMHSGTDHTCHKFHKPEQKDCPNYDTFKYGLSIHHSQYTGYLRSFTGHKTQMRKHQADYFHKDIRFLFGDVDGCSCNIEGYYNPPDMCFPAIGKQCTPNHHGGTNGYDQYTCCDTYPGGTSNNVAHTCEALLQGSNRLQRGLNFLGHLQDFYKRHNSSYHPVYGIFAGSHNSTAAYTSEKFRRWVFGDMKGINLKEGAKAGSSKARDPQEDPFAYDWSSESSADEYEYDDWENEDASDDAQDAQEDPPQETWPPAEAVTSAANPAQPPTQPQAVVDNPTQAPPAPVTQPPVTQPPASPLVPPASPLWVPTRQNWNCNGANSPNSVAETMSNTDGQCQAFCTNYAFSGFWPREHLCRCYSNCAAVGGETSPDFPNTVYQKQVVR